MFFDKSTFLNHFSIPSSVKNEEGYSRIVIDPSGLRWGFLSRENVYESVSSGQRLSSAQFSTHMEDMANSASEDGRSGQKSSRMYSGLQNNGPSSGTLSITFSITHTGYTE